MRDRSAARDLLLEFIVCGPHCKFFVIRRSHTYLAEDYYGDITALNLLLQLHHEENMVSAFLSPSSTLYELDEAW